MANTPEPQDRKAEIAKAWRSWLILFIPCCAAILIAIEWYGFWTTLPFLVLVLAAVLAYQRYVRKRSWHAIIWGVHAAND